MHDARQRRQLGTNPVQQRSDLGLVADVGAEHMDAAPVPIGDLGDGLRGLGIGGTPTGQNNVPGAELGQVRRRVQTDGAESAGDQIGPIGLGVSGFGTCRTILPMCRACCMRRNAARASVTG